MTLNERLKLLAKRLWEDGWYVNSNIVSSALDRIEEMETEITLLKSKLQEQENDRES